MAKKVYKIEAFHGGLNKQADARDIKAEQLAEAFNVEVSDIGQIKMPGSAKIAHQHLNFRNQIVSPTWDDDALMFTYNTTPSAGHGLFTFSHDYNMNGFADNESGNPDEFETEFICINSGSKIHIWDDCHNSVGDSLWIYNAITLGNVNFIGGNNIVEQDEKAKINYYKADTGLRVCDGNFGEEDTNINTHGSEISATSSSLTAASVITLDAGEYIRINSEIIQVVTAVDANTAISAVKRGQFGTKAQAHAAASDIYRINVPKILTHIKRPMLEKTGKGSVVNTWKEDVQCLEPPTDYSTYGLSVFDGNITGMATTGVVHDGSGANATDLEQMLIKPNAPEKVLFSIHESNSADAAVIDCNSSSDGTVINGQSTVNIIAESTDVNFSEEGFTVGKFVIISGSTNIDGLAEIIAMGANAYTIQISAEFVSAESSGYTVRLEENRISEDLANKYVFGMSFMYDGGGGSIQESAIKTGFLYSGLIPHSQAIIESVDNWRTGTDKDGDTSMPTSSASSWEFTDGGLFYDDSDVTSGQSRFVIYEGSSGTITNNGNYLVAIDVTMGSDAELTIYAPGTSESDGGLVGDGTGDDPTVVIDETGKYLFYTTAGDDDTHVFVAEGKDVNNTDTTGDITINDVQVFSATPVEMDASNAIDMRGWEGIPRMFSSFNMNNDSSYKWNERIAGYKIYMKQVDSASVTLTSEWLLALKVNFKTGEYTNYANDSVEQILTVGDSWADSTSSFIGSLVTTVKDTSDTNGISSMDAMRNIPLDTYQSENGYEAEVNTAAMYKTSTIVNRKVFIGNLKIDNTKYPDRMIEAPADRFDTFPDDGLHYIDVAVGDGDEIIKLESFGNQLIQFKKKHAYAFKILDDGIELTHTWSNAGVKAPCQITKTSDGIVWVNNNALYAFDGEKLNQITSETFNSKTWLIEENENNVTILGYDQHSDKVLIITTNVSGQDNGGYIYDVKTQSIVQCQNLLHWYHTFSENNHPQGAE